MPKLPDISSLGARPTPSGGYGFQPPNLSVGSEGKGLMAMGEALGKTSDFMYKLQEKSEAEKEKELEERARLQVSHASSNLIKSVMDFEQEKKNDSAYEKHESEYQEFANKRVTELAQSIDDIKMRERFMADAQGILLSGLGRIRSRAEDKQADSFNLQTKVMADQTTEIFLNAPDEGMRTKAVDSFNEAVENNRFMKPSEKFETKRKWLAHTHEAWLNTLPATEQVKILETVSQKRKSVLNPAAPKDFSQSVDFLLNKIEGERFVENDGGKGPSKYGIVGSQNGLTPEQVRNLTPDQAKAIYKEKYWDAVGAETLPENVRLLAFDTAVNFGVETAKGMLKQSGNDPAALLKLRRDMHRDIAAEKPDTHGQYKKGWEGRDLMLETTVFKDVIAKEDKDTFGIPTDRLNVLLDKARREAGDDMKKVEIEKQSRAAMEIAASTGSLKAGLDYINSNVGYGVAEDVRTRFESMYGAEQKVKKADQEDAYAKIMEQVRGSRDRVVESDIPIELRDRAGRENVLKALNYMPTADNRTYTEAKVAILSGDEYNLEANQHLLGDKYDDLKQLQISKSKENEGPYIKSGLAMIGISQKDINDSSEKAARAAKFTDKFHEEVNAFRENNGGKFPSDADLSRIRGKLIMKDDWGGKPYFEIEETKDFVMAPTKDVETAILKYASERGLASQKPEMYDRGKMKQSYMNELYTTLRLKGKSDQDILGGKWR